MLGEPLARIQFVNARVTEGIARDFFAACFHFLNDGINASAFTEEQMHAIVLCHAVIQAIHLGIEIECHFWQPHGIHIPATLAEEHFGIEIPAVDEFPVGLRGRCSQPTATAAHDFVNHELAHAGGILVRDIRVEESALIGRRPRA